MKKIIIWGYPLKDIEKIEKLKIPFSDQIGISENFNPKKTQPSFDYKWVRAGINDNIYPMPKELFICIKSRKNINFDFIPYAGFYIISKSLLYFLKSHGFDYDFDKSIAHLINTKGEKLTDETFYLLRIISWQIKEEIAYPDLINAKKGFSLTAYINSDKNALLTKNYSYLGTLIINESLKGEILRTFKNPFLYTLSEWKNKS